MPGNRRSIRLPGYDYTRTGKYFLTLCVQNRECLLGEILGDEMRLNGFGDVARACWNEIPDHFPGTELDAFVVMPNHLHGILIINSPVGQPSPVGVSHGMPRQGIMKPGPRQGSLGAIIAVFKSVAGKRINEIRQTPGVRVWQRNFSTT